MSIFGKQSKNADESTCHSTNNSTRMPGQTTAYSSVERARKPVCAMKARIIFQSQRCQFISQDTTETSHKYPLLLEIFLWGRELRQANTGKAGQRMVKPESLWRDEGRTGCLKRRLCCLSAPHADQTSGVHSSFHLRISCILLLGSCAAGKFIFF